MRPRRWLQVLPLWARTLLRPGRAERDLRDELEFHIADRADALAAAGLTTAEARRRAERELGDPTRVAEYCQDSWRGRWLDVLIQDVRYAVRILRRSPGFTAAAATTLALGIGANTAMFSLVNGILLQPLPFPDADRLIQVTGAYPQGGLVFLREQATAMDVAAYAEGHDVNMAGPQEAVRLAGTRVAAGFFRVLGTPAAHGRTLLAGEDLAGSARVAILSHSVWQQHFGGDPGIVGRSIELDGVGHEIVGIMPASFAFPSPRTEVWVPLRIDARRAETYWAGDYMPVIGRLAPGATIEAAEAEVRLLQARLRGLFPWPMPDDWNADLRAIDLQSAVVGELRPRLLLLLAAVVLVLGIACANVANLLLSHGAAREGEMALRAALGAARARVLRQLLTESLMLACAGALLGLGLAAVGLRVITAVLPPDTPRLAEVALDWRVLALAAVLTADAALASGLVPAFHASRRSATDALRSGARGSPAKGARRMRRALVVGEIALAAMLAVASGILVRSFWNLSQVDPGFRAERLLTLRISPTDALCAEADRCVALHRAWFDRVRALPGLNDAAVINTLPLGGRIAKRSVDVQGLVTGPGESAPLVWLNAVSPGYFRVMGIALRSGRTLDAADVAGGARVAVVSAATAQRFWPGEQAVGRRLRLLGADDWHVVVGVVADVRAYDLQRDVPQWIRGTVYVPYGPRAVLEDGRVPAALTLIVRTSLDEASAGGMVRRAVATVDRGATVSEIRPMTAVVSDTVSSPRSTTMLFMAFAALAVALGVTGVYGVLSFLVARRAREIGIRIALGAARRDVLRLVVGEGATDAALGIALGLAGAAGVTRLMAAELYGVSPTDPAVFAAMAGLLFGVTLAACYLPARRAMRVDPLRALRAE